MNKKRYAYDAITNERTYRKALNKAAAIEELKKSAGTQLDPEVVSVFVKMITDENGLFHLQE